MKDCIRIGKRKLDQTPEATLSQMINYCILCTTHTHIYNIATARFFSLCDMLQHSISSRKHLWQPKTLRESSSTRSRFSHTFIRSFLKCNLSHSALFVYQQLYEVQMVRSQEFPVYSPIWASPWHTNTSRLFVLALTSTYAVNSLRLKVWFSRSRLIYFIHWSKYHLWETYIMLNTLCLTLH